MRSVIKMVVGVCCAWLSSFASYAQENKLTAKASLYRIHVRDTIDVVYSFNGIGNDFVPPNYDGFALVSGPIQQTSTQISYLNNKSVTQNSQTLAYTFTPAHSGTITISPACITTKNNHKYCSESLVIVVEESGERHPYVPTPGVFTDTSWLAKETFKKETNREVFDNGIDTLLQYYANPKNNIDTNKPAKLQMQFQFASQKKMEQFNVEAKGKGYIIKALPKNEFDSFLSISRVAAIITNTPTSQHFNKLADDLIPLADKYEGEVTGYGVDKTK